MEPSLIIQNLKTLQDLLASESKRGQTAKIDALRSDIPTAILGHFDRMQAKGRKGLAAVRGSGVCGACYMQIPRAHLAGMQTSHELDVCDHCGAFIYLEASAMVTIKHIAKPVAARVLTPTV